MKSIVIAGLLALPFTSQASLINYTYNSPITGPYPPVSTPPSELRSYEASGQITVDTEKRALVAFDFTSEPVTFSWTGEVGLREPEPDPETSELHVNWLTVTKSSDITPSNAGFYLYLDYFWVGAGEDLFDHLDRVWLNEGATVTKNDIEYSMSGHFQRQADQVPEPTTLSLLFLGLAAIGIRRRVTTLSPR